MSATIRVGVSGAGRVFERLYLPTLRRIPGIDLAAIADPVAGRCALAGPGVHAFGALSDLLREVDVDAIIVLSPPVAHAADAALALGRGLSVLVEKPMCQSPADVELLRELGAGTGLTPAFSRRYWPAYRRLPRHRPIRDLRIAIRVDPTRWGAHSGPADVTEDLFPHVADLGNWLTGSAIEGVTAHRGTSAVEAALSMAGGARVTARLDSRGAYREAVRADGEAFRVGPPSAVASLARRMGRRDDPPVAAMRAMLVDWLGSLRGERSPDLPHFEDGVATVAAMEQLREMLC